MVDFHRLKNLGTDIRDRAGEIAEQAKEKVVPLAEQAKDKVVPLAEQAKDKVAPLAGKAKDVASKSVDKAAGGIDSATGRKFHDKLGDVTGNREKNPTAVAVSEPSDTDAVADSSAEDGGENLPAEDSPPAATADATTADAATADATTADAPSVDVTTAAAPAADVATGDPADDAGDDHHELLIVTDDGSLHHPTPADMPQHRPSNEAS